MSDFMEALVSVTDAFDGWLYSNLLFWALIIVGLFFTIRTRFVQLRMFPEGIRC